MNTTDTETEQI